METICDEDLFIWHFFLSERRTASMTLTCCACHRCMLMWWRVSIPSFYFLFLCATAPSHPQKNVSTGYRRTHVRTYAETQVRTYAGTPVPTHAHTQVPRYAGTQVLTDRRTHVRTYAGRLDGSILGSHRTHRFDAIAAVLCIRMQFQNLSRERYANINKEVSSELDGGLPSRYTDGIGFPEPRQDIRIQPNPTNPNFWRLWEVGEQ